MMEHAERHGLRLPEGWREGLHINATAQTVGMSLWVGATHLVALKRQVKLSSFKWIIHRVGSQLTLGATPSH